MAYYIRKAEIGDCESVLELIRELARYLSDLSPCISL